MSNVASDTDAAAATAAAAADEAATKSAAATNPAFRRATEGFNHLWYNLRSSNQSALKGALYNLAIVAVCAAIFAVCLVLGPFLKPLLWSVLIGAVLFPFKKRLSFALKSWFAALEADDTHLAVGVLVAPVQALQALGAYLTGVLGRHWQQIGAVAAALTGLWVFVEYAPQGVALTLWSHVRWAHLLFTSVLGGIDYKIVLAVLVCYVSTVAFVWRPDNSFYFMLFGQTLWVVLVAYACSFFGALQVPVFVAALAYALAGVVYDLKARACAAPTRNDGQHETVGMLDRLCSCSLLDLSSSLYTNGVNAELATTPADGLDELSLLSEADNDNNDDEANRSTTTSTTATTVAGRSQLRLDVKPSKSNVSLSAVSAQLPHHTQSGVYFHALFIACAATVAYNYCWILFVATVPIGVHLVGRLAEAFAVREVLGEQLEPLWASAHRWVIARHSAVLPVCLPGVLRLNRKVHRSVRRALRDSIDTASSILMIVLLLLSLIFAGVFCAVEIYSEAITVVQLGNDVVNWTLCHRPELMNMFPEGVTNSMESVIENAYQNGRKGIGTYVDELLKDADPEQRKQLREQLLSVWDRTVQYWLNHKRGAEGSGGGGGGGGSATASATTGTGDGVVLGPDVPASAITDQIGEIVNNEGNADGQPAKECKKTEVTFKRLKSDKVAQQGLIGWVKKNLDILMEVSNSARTIVQANLSVLTSLCWTLFSLFLGGGQAVITFIINSIIFLTALFYLLSSSEDRYAPLAAVNYLGLASGPRIALAIERSVSSVLFASAKLALFHGLFTWLTHTCIGARVVFLPTVLASVLAALPFLGTYWCSLPAFLDLWLIQDRFTLGVVLLAVHFLLPSTFVDPAIYADVNGGGHAYLTGLSIAGGMFWLGWEGAIFGPILLCLLVVMFNLTSNALKESPATPRIASTDYRITDRRRHSAFQQPSYL